MVPPQKSEGSAAGENPSPSPESSEKSAPKNPPTNGEGAEDSSIGKSVGKALELEPRLERQEERSKTYATREWVYVSFLKYIVPSMLILIGLAFTYLIHFNQNIMRMLLRVLNE